MNHSGSFSTGKIVIERPKEGDASEDEDRDGIQTSVKGVRCEPLLGVLPSGPHRDPIVAVNTDNLADDEDQCGNREDMDTHVLDVPHVYVLLLHNLLLTVGDLKRQGQLGVQLSRFLGAFVQHK